MLPTQTDLKGIIRPGPGACLALLAAVMTLVACDSNQQNDPLQTQTGDVGFYQFQLPTCAALQVNGTLKVNLLGQPPPDISLPVESGQGWIWYEVAPAVHAAIELDVSDDSVSLGYPASDSAPMLNVFCPRLASVRLMGEAQLLQLPAALVPNIAHQGYAPALEIQQVFAYGASRAVMSGGGDRMEVRAAADATVAVTGLVLDQLTVGVAGRGEVHMSGEANELMLSVSGTGRLDARELRVQSVYVEGSGQAQVAVFATAHLQDNTRGTVVIENRGPAAITRP